MRACGGEDPLDPLDRIEAHSAVLVRNFELLRRRSMSSSELERAHYLLLRTLDTAGPHDIGSLALQLGLDPSTVGRQVASMEMDGLVLRAPDPADRRRSVVEATEAGLSRMRATREYRRSEFADLLEGWDVDDLHTLATMFGRYNEAVTQKYVRAPAENTE